MMTASDVIESYVEDVAAQLPRAKRADVAAELQSLLSDEIGASANADEALARLRAFGRPSDVAARYHAPFVLVEPSDTRAFITAAVAGALLIPSTNRHLPISVDQQTATLLLLAWIGTLVLLFAASSWSKRRWPQSFAWTPSRVRDRDAAGLFMQLCVVSLFALIVAVYLAPGTLYAVFTDGDPAHLAYTDDFRQPLRMLGFPLLMSVAAGLHLAAGLRRRWTPLLRALAICFLVSAGIQLGWHASYGDVFADPAVDRIARLVFENIGGVMLILAGVEAYREWIRIPGGTKFGTPATQ